MNLDTIMPTLVPEYLPPGIPVGFQGKNGALVRLLRSGLLGSVWSASFTKARQSLTSCSRTPTVHTPLGFPRGRRNTQSCWRGIIRALVRDDTPRKRSRPAKRNLCVQVWPNFVTHCGGRLLFITSLPPVPLTIPNR